jgi:hypothetical protein
MKFIVEFKSFYKVDDIVLIEYWWDDMITPVKILEQTSPRTLKISHNIPQSKINNAPDEIIKTSDIIDHSR